MQKRQRPDCIFSKLNTQPACTPVYASPCTSRCTTQNSGPSGSLLLSRGLFHSLLYGGLSPAHCFGDLATTKIWQDPLGRGSPAAQQKTFPLSALALATCACRAGRVGLSAGQQVSLQLSDISGVPGVKSETRGGRCLLLGWWRGALEAGCVIGIAHTLVACHLRIRADGAGHGLVGSLGALPVPGFSISTRDTTN